jgi:hypothetical protein
MFVRVRFGLDGVDEDGLSCSRGGPGILALECTAER